MFPMYTKYSFFSHWFSEWEFLIAPFPLIIIIAYFFPFRCHFREVTFTARLEFRKYKYSRPLKSFDYLKQIHIPFNAVSGSHFYGKPIYCLFKKADICYAILDILFNKYDIYLNLLDICYKEDILYSKYDIHIIILNIQNVNILCKINLAIFDVAYIFDHLRAILDISSI